MTKKADSPQSGSVQKTRISARIRAFSRSMRRRSQLGRLNGGEGGIRTHEPAFGRLPAFEAGSFNRSDTSPQGFVHSSEGSAAGQRQRAGRCAWKQNTFVLISAPPNP